MTQLAGTTMWSSGNPDRPYDDEDLSSKAFWAQDMFAREVTFKRLRAKDTITWHQPFEEQLLEDPNDYGFWAVTGYDDLVQVTKRHEDFISSPGVLLENLPPEYVENGQSLLAMDPPRHTLMRRLVAAAFTPKQMTRIREMVLRNSRDTVRNLLDKAEAGGGQTDFVAECAELLPMNNINDMLGVSAEERQHTMHAMRISLSWNDPEVCGSTKEEVMGNLFGAIAYCHNLVAAMAVERREHPTPDLVSSLVNAEVEGKRLTPEEIGAFFVLLTGAGNDTTRQSMAHGLTALTDRPEQRAWLLEDLPGRMPSAVEELVRWAAPVMTMRRTAARDLEFRGRRVTKGDKLVMFYASANHDERRIERPDELDLSRNPNPHVNFGGGGAHHCLGNQLARLQLGCIFTELLTQAPEIRATAPPVLSPSTLLNAVKRLPCEPFPGR